MNVNLVNFSFFIFYLSFSGSCKLLKCFTNDNWNNCILIKRCIDWGWCSSLILWLIPVMSNAEKFIAFIRETWNCLSFCESWISNYLLFQLLLFFIVKPYFFVKKSFFALWKLINFLNVAMVIEKWSNWIALCWWSFQTHR